MPDSMALGVAQDMAPADGTPVTLPVAGSEATPAVQDQQPPAGQSAPEPTFTAAQVEQMRRDMQSAKDREIHQARMEALAENRKAQEDALLQQRLADMTDDEYGAYKRGQENEEKKIRESNAAFAAQFFTARQAQLLAKVTDPAAQAEIQEKVRSGQIKTYSDFEDVVHEARVNAAIAKRQASSEKDEREASVNGAVAAAASTGGPVTRSGLPTSAVDTSGWSSERMIAYGLSRGN